MDPQSKQSEQESPRFYHLELYDSSEDLAMFLEEPFRRRDLALQEKRQVSAKLGGADQNSSQKDAEEPARPDKNKDTEVELAASSESTATGSTAELAKNSHLTTKTTHIEHIQSTEEKPIPGKNSQVQHPDNESGSNGRKVAVDEQPFKLNSQEKDKDSYCITCCVPIRALDDQGSHHDEHEVIPLLNVVEIAKDELQKYICKLEDQIAHLENFSSHLEEIFITVEENFAKQEQNFERHYNDVMQTLEQRYEESMQALGEEKKEKLEALYKQLVNCGENLDTCKELMEAIEDLGQGENKLSALKTAIATIRRLDDFLKKDVDVKLSTPADFEDRVIDFSDVGELMDSVIAVPAVSPPCAPVMNSQDPNSATGTSVRVCWSFFSEDIIESYQLFYRRVSNDISKDEQDEFMLNVKETYATVTNLVPNTQYEIWVRALNSAGAGLACERAVYLTAPLPPVIKRKEIQSCERAALVSWESGNTNPVDSYSVELSKLTDGGDGDMTTESIIGIPNCETLIQLDPRTKYLLAVKAMNMGGPSERSEPVSIVSTGTYFTLNEETAHPLLSVLEDGFTITCRKADSPKSDLSFCENSFTRSIAILGKSIPFHGKHYWEVDVNDSIEYRIGVAFENVSRDSYLGTSHSCWCMRHTVTPSRHIYEFLNNGMTPDIRITVPPRKVGLLLDYDDGTLSFFNTDLMQHLYTFHSHFQDFVCPCFAVEEPGTLRIRNSLAMPTHIFL
ncbi:PREDICTED: fibronectin type III and SPRY domain-containing protein 2 isoform X2 [Gekko japonicus]|uniref:Fibronectin type III and SPRY domain-containing protein 2 isoform X2 n=1 Tax=Gekko japonicus TaxID=146911 RepID=A0ABM1KR73_GEKJA|nr:PREDICTED: fibronectin type III and SPRY domain-containing protein 2 isoform X2 [Gekko japonicus]